jgi:hypothetical protein
MDKSIFIESYKKWEKSREEVGPISESDRLEDIREWLSKNTNYRSDILKYVTNYALYKTCHQLNELFAYLNSPEKDMLFGALILISIQQDTYVKFCAPGPFLVMEFRVGLGLQELSILAIDRVLHSGVDFHISYLEVDKQHLEYKPSKLIVIISENNYINKNSTPIEFRDFPLLNDSGTDSIERIKVLTFEPGEIRSNPFKCADAIYGYLSVEYSKINSGDLWLI